MDVRGGLLFAAVLLAALSAALAAVVGSAPSPAPVYASGALAFARDGDLYVAAADGRGEELVASHPQAIESCIDGLTFRFSPDGTSLAYIRDGGTAEDCRGAPSSELLLRMADGRTRSLVRDDAWFDFAWAPDGQRLVIATVGLDPRVSIVDLGGDVVGHVVMPEGFSLRDPDLSGVSPISWSPDGRWIAVPGCVGCDWKHGLYYLVVPADGQGATWPPGSTLGGQDAYAAWAPDARLAVPIQGRIEILSPEPVGEVPHIPLPDGRTAGARVAWSADGTTLAASAVSLAGRDSEDLAIVNADGGGSTVLPIHAPVGGVGEMLWSQDGARVLLVEGAGSDGPRSTIVSVPVQGGDPMLLVDGVDGHFNLN
jgi:dipeptidyl aminopeptidase/acylaminoacyl peptidase